MAIDPASGMIFVKVGGGGGRHETGDYVGVWSIYDDGEVAPRWTIGLGILKDVRGVAIDTKTQSVFVTDKTLNSILTFHVPEAF